MNVKPQEVNENGERSIRYKGSDGMFHRITPEDQTSKIGIEEKQRTVSINVSELQSSSLNINEFILAHLGSKFSNFKVTNASYSSASANKIYFANGIKGSFPYYYDIQASVVTFYGPGSATLDQITKEAFTSDMDAVKSFFERTIATVIDKLSPFNLYYFIKNAGMVIKNCKFNCVDKHVVVTDKNGDKEDAGILVPLSNVNY